MSSSWKSGPQNYLEKECQEYFRSASVYRQMFRKLAEKYASYGFFAGSIVFTHLTPADREVLEGFLRKSLGRQKQASVSTEKIRKALTETRFAELSLERITELVLEEPLFGKKERLEQEKSRWLQTLEETSSRLSADLVEKDPAACWLHLKSEEYREFRSLSPEREKQALQRLDTGVRILASLPAFKNKTEYLAVFAAEITGNPHAFDDGTEGGRLLSEIMEWLDTRYCSEADLSAGYFSESALPAFGKSSSAAASLAAVRSGGPSEDGKNSIEKKEIFPGAARLRKYLRAGILRDDVSNHTMLYGVTAGKKDGTPHAGINGFNAERQIFLAPLQVVWSLAELKARNNRILIVENPSVFAGHCMRYPEQSCLCMNGQPRLASLLAMDLLAGSGTEVWYGGDLDPEGILIAQKLKQYYKGAFRYWHMSESDYLSGISGQEIPDKRLKILEQITDPELAAVSAAVRTYRRAAYQESMKLFS